MKIDGVGTRDGFRVGERVTIEGKKFFVTKVCADSIEVAAVFTVLDGKEIVSSDRVATVRVQARR